MKNTFKLIYLLVLALSLFNCSDDDNNVIITVEDLTVAIDENPTDGQVVGIIQASGEGALSFSITSQTPVGALAINASTGELTVVDPNLFDFETNPVITATILVDNTVDTATAVATINLNNLDEVSAQNLTVSINENPANGQVVGAIQATGGNLTYAITFQNPAGAFNINASTGELTVANAALFNFETQPNMVATVSVANAINTVSVNATVSVNDVNEIGEFKHGGVIFWLDGNGGGLVCNVTDLNAGAAIQWGNNGIEYQATGATATAIGNGQANTNAIISTQGPGTYAATLCDNLSLNGFSDWYLPSKDELNQMYVNRTIINTVALANGGTAFSVFYWTSSQATTNTNIVWIQFFQGGSQSINNKLNSTNVRAVRTF